MENYNEIYQRMKNAYEQSSRAVFNEESDIAIRLKVLAGEIYNAQTSMEWLKRQMFSSTASGEYLDYLASQRGLKRKQATKAQGELMFLISEPKDHAIIIPKGAVVATTDSEPLRFVTTEDEEISAGGVLVSVYAEAEEPGSRSNIGKEQAIVPVSIPAEIETVTNKVVFEAGEDAESDDELRERIKASYLNQSNGTNAAYYEQLALSVEGIAKAGVAGRVRGQGTVNVYVCGKNTAASDAAVAKVQALMNKERELNVDVTVYKAQFVNYDLAVSVKAKSGYGESEVRTKCRNVFVDYVNSLPVGGKLYLSALGARLLATDCIVNYTFGGEMADTSCTVTQCFLPGNISIEVI